MIGAGGMSWWAILVFVIAFLFFFAHALGDTRRVWLGWGLCFLTVGIVLAGILQVNLLHIT